MSGTAPWDVFRGAAAITDEDSIYGREEDLQQVLALILAPGFRFGTLWGETGCGKTSLVRAGLMPALRRQGYLPVYLNRYDDPETEVSRAVATAAGLETPAASLAETLRAAAQATDTTVVLLCDQFEQVFTNPAMRDRQKRTAFLRYLADGVNNLTLVRCLLLMRADHLYSLTEFDAFTPLHHPLAQDKRYELRWLREADAARVLSRMQEAAQAVWPDALINAVVADLASDGRVKPVQIQLVAAGLYLRHINTLDTYIEVGRVDGVLKDYLTAVFDTLSQPALARRVVRSLVMPGNPPIHLPRSVSDMAREIREPESAVQAVLDGLTTPHVVQTRTDTTPATYELVHDVLLEPALRATTVQEIGLGILRSALAQRRWRLRWREYRAAKRSDVTELPERQQPAARQLLRRTFCMRLVLGMATVCVGLFGFVTAVQLTTAHVRIESDPPEPLVVRRGLRRLDFLPGFLGPVPLFDTGLAVQDVPSHKRTSLEAITLYSWDDTISPRIHQLSEHLWPASAAQWLFSMGDWEGGFRIVGDITERDRRERALNGVEYMIPAGAIPSLLAFATKDNPASARAAVVSVLDRFNRRHAAETVPALLPLLRDPDEDVRHAAAPGPGAPRQCAGRRRGARPPAPLARSAGPAPAARSGRGCLGGRGGGAGQNLVIFSPTRTWATGIPKTHLSVA